MLSVSYDEMFMNFTQQFLQSFEKIANCDFQVGTHFDFEIEGRTQKKRINPLIRLATPEDIDEIIFTYRDIYEDSYPYKEMEDPGEIRRMIKSPKVEWLIFETLSGEIVGSFTFILDFEKKLGNIRGFVIKKKFLGKVDIMKMAMGSIIAMYKKYNDRIFRWYGECRTAHTKSQHFCSAFGFKPVGFYPCKDIFYNKVESDLLIVSYDERALTTLRCKNTPKILPEVLNGFLYSDRRYHLGSCKIENFNNVSYNNLKIKKLGKMLLRNISKDRFGYETIIFSFDNSDSYFEFLYTPTVQNFEKTSYKVNSIEELYVFVKEFLKYGKQYNIRYCEAFVSAYKPNHQKLFYDLGLYPRGYVPSWNYNHQTRKFDDFILFNWYRGEIVDIQLLDEGKDLLDILGVQYSCESRSIQQKHMKLSHLSPLKL
ncbi:MAG: GNAT family N-acetyltransferase [Promethearchaeota archaeon]